MTHTNENNDDIRQLLAELTHKQIQTETAIQVTQSSIQETQNSIQETQQELRELASETQNSIQETQQELRELASETRSMLARNEIVNDTVLEMRESHETMKQSFMQHQINFERHQATSNAALQSLEAILLQFIRLVGRE
jgi:uncharacterized coiled-coil DUF342 family protein